MALNRPTVRMHCKIARRSMSGWISEGLIGSSIDSSGKHPRLISPDIGFVVLSGSPSDVRSRHNVRAYIRRAHKCIGS